MPDTFAGDSGYRVPEVAPPGGSRTGILPHFAVLIPAYNEAATIAAIVERAVCEVGRVLVVDDGSTDGTALAAERAGATVLRQDRNRGKGDALQMGLKAIGDAGYSYAVTLDGDGQHRAADIPALAAMAAPDRIVIGSRMSERHHIPSARYKANQTANFFISWACGTWIEDTQSGFRIYPLGVLERVRLRERRKYGFVFESEILIEACRAGFRVRTAPIPALYDNTIKRASHFRPVRDIAAIVAMVTGKILRWGFYPAGLLRSQYERRNLASRVESLPS
ncbi:MAG: glycosyltransferase [Alphaproteobacteria bacterium]|nr:glycosyltransferase [Alphaproteobacteria bacterium]